MKKNGACVLFGLLMCLILPLTCQEGSSFEYRIGPRDLLEVQIFGFEELSNFRVRVLENGMINLPILGQIEANGLTSIELEGRLKDILMNNRFLESPMVTVFIAEYQSKFVSLIGAVNNQGVYPIIGRQRLLHFFTLAGGISPAAGPDIFIIRENEKGEVSSLKLSRIELLDNVDMAMNIPLQPNDIIHVPEDTLVPIYVGGQVSGPGMQMVRKSLLPTLLQAIIQAGGFAGRASKGGVLLKRRNAEGTMITTKYDVKDIINGKREDVQLQAGDIVWVPQSTF
ncbi:polysaccharide biosynthesis/export family protein [Acidobacteriota bacterium]